MLKFYKLKFYGVLFLIYLGFGMLFTYPLIFKMSSSIYGAFYNTDVRGTIWSLWWLRYSAIHHIDYNNCYFLAAPFGVNFSFLPVLGIGFLISKIMVVFAGFILSVNLLTLILFALTGCFAYLLCYDLTEKKEASFVCGFIFAFCPYHLNKVMEFTYIFLGAGIVLYIWALLKLKEKSNLKMVILAAIAGIFTLNFNPYYGFFAIIFTLCFFIFCLFYQFKNKLADLKNTSGRKKIFTNTIASLSFVRDVAIIFFLVILLDAQSLWNITKMIFFSHYNLAEHATMGYVRSFDYLIAQSARPLSYLLPASTHPLFGNFTKSMFGSFFYGRGSIEQTLYLGWVPLILAFVAFRQWRHKRLHVSSFPDYQSSKENFYIGFFIFAGWMAFFFSMPPIVNLGIVKIYMPSYFTYKFAPIFRAYARFGMIVMLCVSILAGYGIKAILEKIRKKRLRFIFISFVFLLIIFEFTNVPPFRVTDLKKVPEVYLWLAKQKSDFIIVEYPMATPAPGEAWENYDYLFYQTIHQKKIVNGAISGSKSYEVKKKITRVADPLTQKILYDLGVKYVIFHENLYAKGTFPDAVDIIGEVPQLEKIAGYKLINKFGDDWVYEVGDTHV